MKVKDILEVSASLRGRKDKQGVLRSRHTRSNSSEMNKTFKTFLRLSGDTGAFAAIFRSDLKPVRPAGGCTRKGKPQGVIGRCKKMIVVVL